MREIKFRVWDKNSNIMLYHHNGWTEDVDILEDVWQFIKDFNFKIMQYTNYKDINEKEIYEHDFIKIKGWNDNWIFEIKWSNKYCGFIAVNIYDDSYEIILYGFAHEVIGNRFENPEILEIEQKKEESKKQYKIISNKIKCNHCGDIIESTYRHDFKWCKCERVSVDGGKDYLKRSFKEEGDYEDLSETVEI